MPHISVITVFCAAGALGPGLLALMFALVWRAQRATWAALFAGAHGIVALLYTYRLVVTMDTPVAGKINIVPVAVALATLMMLTFGFARYVDVPRPAARKIEWISLAVVAAVFVVAFTAGLTGPFIFAVFAGFILSQGVMVAWAVRREPRHGHGVVLAASLMYPLTVVLVVVGGYQLLWLCFAVIAPLTLTGATVLTTGLLRAQARAAAELQRRELAEAELQALNDTLELRVAQRSARQSCTRWSAGWRASTAASRTTCVVHRAASPACRAWPTTLWRAKIPPAVQRMLSMITAQADALAQLVTDLLALARVRDAELLPQTIDLQAFVRETLEQMRLNQPNGEPLSVEVGTLPNVQADPGLLRQVVVNLLGNAIKFSRDAKPPHIELGAIPGEGEQVLYVRDNGVGFAAEQAERLFQPFKRLHGQAFAGHGVGLSIVKRIIERHGGRLWAQAQPNMGATFFFSLPVRRH